MKQYGLKKVIEMNIKIANRYNQALRIDLFEKMIINNFISKITGKLLIYYFSREFIDINQDKFSESVAPLE
jgi:hypothetical protein